MGCTLINEGDMHFECLIDGGGVCTLIDSGVHFDRWGGAYTFTDGIWVPL